MRILTACLAFGLVTVYAGLAPAEVIYRELYTTEVAGDLSTLAGWTSREGATALPSFFDITAPSIGGPNPNLSAVNSNPAAGTIGRTYQRTSGNTGNPFITYTSEYAIDLALNSLTEMRFWERNALADGTLTHDTLRLAVEIGGVWRVTDLASALTGTTQDTGDGIWSEQSLNLATATWSSLTFIPGTSLSAPGAVSPLPGTGTITTFGLYTPSIGGGVSDRDYRLDSVELSAVPVPEPSSVAMLLFGGVVLRLVGRKRRA